MKKKSLFRTLLLLSSCTALSAMPTFAATDIRINPDTVQNIKYIPSNDIYLPNGTLFSNDLKTLVVRPDAIFHGLPSEGCTIQELLDSLSRYQIDYFELHRGEGVCISIAGLTIEIGFDEQFEWWYEMTKDHVPSDAEMEAFYEKIRNLKIYPSGGLHGEQVVIGSTAEFNTSDEEEDLIIDQAAEYFRSFSNAASPAISGSWKQDENGWWYDNGNGTFPVNTWQWIDSNEDGVFECYYFDEDGYLLSDTTTPDGYQVNADGAWIENGTICTQ